MTQSLKKIVFVLIEPNDSITKNNLKIVTVKYK